MAAAQAVKGGRGGWGGGLRATNAKVILYTPPRHKKCKPTPNSSPWQRHLILLSFLESVKTWWMAKREVMLSWEITIYLKMEDIMVAEFVSGTTQHFLMWLKWLSGSRVRLIVIILNIIGKNWPIYRSEDKTLYTKPNTVSDNICVIRSVTSMTTKHIC